MLRTATCKEVRLSKDYLITALALTRRSRTPEYTIYATRDNARYARSRALGLRLLRPAAFLGCRRWRLAARRRLHPREGRRCRGSIWLRCGKRIRVGTAVVVTDAPATKRLLPRIGASPRGERFERRRLCPIAFAAAEALHRRKQLIEFDCLRLWIRPRRIGRTLAQVRRERAGPAPSHAAWRETRRRQGLRRNGGCFLRSLTVRIERGAVQSRSLGR